MREGDSGTVALGEAQDAVGIEPAAFGDGPRVFPHHDALHGTFGKPQSLWDEATA